TGSDRVGCCRNPVRDCLLAPHPTGPGGRATGTTSRIRCRGARRRATGSTRRNCACRTANCCRTGAYPYGAGDAEATGARAGADGGARPKLRGTCRQASRNAGPEDAKAEKRQGREDKRECILEGGLVAAESLCELTEQCGANADDDGKH